MEVNKEKKFIYRTIAQTEDGVTLTADTSTAVTLQRAEIDVEDHVLPKSMQSGLKPYVTLPVASAESWEYGHVNFCPRCGKHLGDDEGTDSNTYYGDCFECGAELDITITGVHTPHEDEAEDDEDDA